ncbi:hypothetical protein FHS19_000630 [Paenibacillus rhizosphaerae]|uniref:Uncharacterized protein n=1 Tax=Paenibacillus rhizosphaerae TaxID=297318 RepID=A0A839TGM3_9BACL|nr:hypothetical protein [Paenibacillus rhizosphaerae]
MAVQQQGPGRRSTPAGIILRLKGTADFGL